MTVLVDEIGAMAADNVRTILARADGADQIWKRLVAGGWTALGADPDAGLGLRELQEIARVAGSHPVPVPLVTTLLAGRWFSLEEAALEAGVAVAVRRGEETVVPYAVPGAVVVDAEGARLDAPARIETFSAAMPLAILDVAATPELSDERRGELHAVLAAVAVGCADAVAERAIAWAGTREQFGRPILKFQAVRHHLANLHIAREQAWTAAVAGGHEPEHAARWSRLACDLSVRSMELGIQVHGGVGFTAEVGLHLYLDHVLQIASVLGGAARDGQV